MGDQDPAVKRPTTTSGLRRDPLDMVPIFVHSEIDDLPLSTNAFRVYAHLARRAGKENSAWPSYSSIGEHCFRSSYPRAKEATLRRRAIEAVNELEQRGLIEVVRRRGDDRGHTSNEYRLLSRREWRERLVEREREQGDKGGEGDPPVRAGDVPF